jgi:hypothetical protein
MNTAIERNISPDDSPPGLKKDWRFYAGIAALLLAMVLPLFGLAVPLLGLSTAPSALLIGVLVAGGPEVLLLVAAALLGKDTLHAFFYKAKHVVGRVFLNAPASKGQ